MNPFLPDEVEALRALVRTWPNSEMVVLGAGALRCFMPMSWRTTEDLDLSVAASIEDATAALSFLPGWSSDPRQEQRWRTPSGIAVDIVPASDAALARGYIEWPRSGFRMSLLGMRLAFEHAVALHIAPDLEVRVAPSRAAAGSGMRGLHHEARHSLPSPSRFFEFLILSSGTLAPTREGPRAMNFRVGVTDGNWYELLANQPGLDEVNFWQPSGNHQFRALSPGELFLFKLHSPNNFIVGGGVFAHASLLPASLAWESFGIANGATTIVEMRARIEKYRKLRPTPHEDYRIGCIILTQPFFFSRDRWIPVPESWKRSIVQGKTYAHDGVEGRPLWRAVQDALQGMRADILPSRPVEGVQTGEAIARFGEPTLVRPRLGQGSFRVCVTDAYDRRCAVTMERTLPVLEAAHIKPYADGGEHRIDNGLLLRRDLHTLFDRGYLTVTPESRLEVSRRLKDDWENGRDYYALHGRELRLPMALGEKPKEEYLAWHREEKWLG